MKGGAPINSHDATLDQDIDLIVSGQKAELSAAKAKLFYINNFDLIRFFAATQVLIFHAAYHLDFPVPGWLAPLGDFQGVPIFFVTSGFLISASYERSSTLWSYARNRARRIFPALWTCIALTTVIVLVLGYRAPFLPIAAWFCAQFVGFIYTPDFLRSFGFGSYNGSLWTIPVELQFYLLTPILYWIISRFRRPNLALGGIFVIFVCLAFVIRQDDPGIMQYAGTETLASKLMRYSFIPSYFLFLAGVLLRRLELWSHPAVKGKVLFWIAGLLVFAKLAPHGSVFVVVQNLILAICAISGAYTFTGANKILRGNDVSYGVYIYHGLILGLMVEAGFKHQLSQLAIVLVAAYGAGLLSWKLVEQPLLGRKTKAIHHLGEQPSAAGAG